MNGIFGFAIYDVDKESILALTINYSIIYWLGSTRNFYVASELKALEGYCTKKYNSGHYMTSRCLYNGTKRMD
jgi:asparagine synthase (glutamine-hydrolysing)